MNPQLVLLFAMTLALYAIVWKMFHSPMKPSPTLVVKPTMIRIPHDIVSYDTNMRGTGKRIHQAQMNGYYFVSKNGSVVTYKRDEIFVPAGAW